MVAPFSPSWLMVLGNQRNEGKKRNEEQKKGECEGRGEIMGCHLSRNTQKEQEEKKFYGGEELFSF